MCVSDVPDIKQTVILKVGSITTLRHSQPLKKMNDLFKRLNVSYALLDQQAKHQTCLVGQPAACSQTCLVGPPAARKQNIAGQAGTFPL